MLTMMTQQQHDVFLHPWTESADICSTY